LNSLDSVFAMKSCAGQGQLGLDTFVEHTVKAVIATRVVNLPFQVRVLGHACIPQLVRVVV
jgi:hypothetical protein